MFVTDFVCACQTQLCIIANFYCAFSLWLRLLPPLLLTSQFTMCAPSAQLVMAMQTTQLPFRKPSMLHEQILLVPLSIFQVALCFLCFSVCRSHPQTRINFTGGRYKITKSVTVPAAKQLVVTGDGWSSSLLWAVDAHMLMFTASPTAVMIRDLRIASIAVKKTITNFAIWADGMVRSQIDRLLIEPGVWFYPCFVFVCVFVCQCVGS